MQTTKSFSQLQGSLVNTTSDIMDLKTNFILQMAGRSVSIEKRSSRTNMKFWPALSLQKVSCYYRPVLLVVVVLKLPMNTTTAEKCWPSQLAKLVYIVQLGHSPRPWFGPNPN